MKRKKSPARTRALAEELDWIRSSPKGRQTKSKARIREFEALVSQQSQEQRQQLELRILQVCVWATRFLNSMGFRKALVNASSSKI